MLARKSNRLLAGSPASPADADLRTALGVPNGTSLHDWMTEFVASLGLPTNLTP